MNTLARDYILLAFAINQHIPGYIDAYFGPDEVKADADARGLIPVPRLAIEAERLAETILDADLENQRREFLISQISAMRVTLRLLLGEKIPLAHEVELLYGLAPDWVDEARFSDAHQQLNALLPSGGSLRERLAAYKKSTEVPAETAVPLLDEIRRRLRVQARQRYSLPAEEDFEIVLVKNKPWGGYNWFLGKARSRIEINTDLPLRAPNMLGLMSHEGYPGHHTELALKEMRLLNEKGWQEHGIALINAPSCAISEGLANCALDTILTPAQQTEWETELYARAGLSLDAAWVAQVRSALKPLGRASGNAAFLIYEQGATHEQAAEYLEKWTLGSPQEARKSVEFISHPLYRSYIFNYSLGMDLLERLFAVKGGREPWFTRLLAEPVTPQMVTKWIERK